MWPRETRSVTWSNLRRKRETFFSNMHFMYRPQAPSDLDKTRKPKWRLSSLKSAGDCATHRLRIWLGDNESLGNAISEVQSCSGWGGNGLGTLPAFENNGGMTLLQ